MIETVGFTSMAAGTREDYLLLARLEERMVAGLPDRLLRALDALRDSFDGYRVTRYEHSLQAATRALRDGRDEEYVVATLLHDLGDELAPHNHGELAAAILRPYVREEVHWIIRHHGAFQMYYYAHHYGLDRDVRDRWAGHPWYAACAEFCERYDQVSFDPAYDTLPIAEFEPMLRRVVARPRYGPT